MRLWMLRGERRAGLINRLRTGDGVPDKCGTCTSYYEPVELPEEMERIGRDHMVMKYPTGFVYRFPNSGGAEAV